MILASHGLIASQIQSFVGLLDLYPSAAAAYSVRKLRAAYTGSAIRVRRTDLSEQNIGFNSSGNLDTAALLSFVGTGALDNGFITTWYDQSGNLNNAVQTTAINQPQIVSAGSILTQGINPSLKFDNTDGFTLTTAFNLGNFTILWVTKRASTNDNGMILTGLGGGDFMGDEIQTRGNPQANCSGGTFIDLTKSNTSASNLETTYHLAYLNRRNSTEAVGQFNNSNNNYNNAISSGSVDIRRISKYLGGDASFDFVGNMQEIIIYSSDKSSNRTGISTNINTYYAIY